MIPKILGSLDIIAALSIWLFHFLGILQGLLMLVAFYLLFKGLLFLIWKDIASIADIIIAFMVFLTLTSPLPSPLIILAVLFLLQKGVFSLLG